MDFSLTDEQQMLQDSVLRFLEKEYAFGQRQAIVTAGGFSREKWKAFAELGWLALPFAEKDGGLGGGAVEIAIVMQAFGRHLVLEPYLDSIVVGGLTIARHAAEGVREDLLPRILAGDGLVSLADIERGSGFDLHHVATSARKDGNGFVLDGQKPVVPGGTLANHFIVSARTAGGRNDTDGVTLFLVSRASRGVKVEPYRGYDGTPAASVSFDRVRLERNAVLGEVDGGLPLLEQTVNHGIAALCAEAVGSMTYLVEATGRHLKTRRQYGRALAEFQALQHRMADMYVGTELARSLSLYCSMMLDKPAPERMTAASAAKVEIGRRGRFVGENAVQLHGGMGMSEELDISHHYKRLALIGSRFGDHHHHLRRFASLTQQAG